jgi:transposase-like protein
MWVWRALALPSRLRVASHLSHDRSEPEARAFLAKFKARTDGRAPFFTSDQLPAYVAALVAILGAAGSGTNCSRLCMAINY